MGQLAKALNERPWDALPSNTIPNPQEDIRLITTQSGITLAGLSVPSPNSSSSFKEVERDPELTMDQVHISSSKSTTRILSPVIQPASASKSNKIHERNHHQPPIPYPSRLNKDKIQDKSDIQTHKFLQMFKKLHFNEKLLDLANTPLNENCSAVLLKKLPEKHKDPRKFFIPCDFSKLKECMALADLGANINLMPLSVWKKLMLHELIPTRMTLELANRSVAYPDGIAKDVFVQVGKFTFPADFVVVDYDVDPRVPLILRRPFLRMVHSLVDVHGEELTLRVCDEKLVFNVESTSKYPHKHEDESINQIDIIDTTCEDHFHEVLNGDILFLEKLLNNDPTKDLLPKELKNDKTKMTKSSIEEPPELELKDLPPHVEYALLEGTSKLPVIIAKDLKMEENDQLIKVLKSHKRAIAWKISDIKGIDPTFCTHKILMQDDFKPAVQH
ncbi:reverse transcriptase domain-containing protein [Tanacetum coccineum]